MTYKEFLSDTSISPIVNTLKLKFPNCLRYLENKYNRYELLYNKDEMLLQYLALFDEYSNMLLNIEDAFTIRDTNKNTIDNLGETNKRKKVTEYSSTGMDSTNYVGYEVIGEYERKNDTLNTNNDVDDKSNTYNFLSALTRLETEGNRLGWFKFEKRFIKLFITLYVVEW